MFSGFSEIVRPFSIFITFKFVWKISTANYIFVTWHSKGSILSTRPNAFPPIFSGHSETSLFQFIFHQNLLLTMLAPLPIPQCPCALAHVPSRPKLETQTRVKTGIWETGVHIGGTWGQKNTILAGCRAKAGSHVSEFGGCDITKNSYI